MVSNDDCFKFQRFVNEFDGLDTVINYFLLHAPEGVYGNAPYLNKFNRRLFNLIGKLSEIKGDKVNHTHKRKASFEHKDLKKGVILDTKDMFFTCRDSKQMVSILDINGQDSNRRGKFTMGGTLYDICQNLVTTDLISIHYKEFSDVTDWVIKHFPFDIVEKHYFIIANDNTYKQINIELAQTKKALANYINLKALKEKELLTTVYKSDTKHDILRFENSIKVCQRNIKTLTDLYIESTKTTFSR